MTGREFPIESNAVWLREVLNEKYRIPAYQRPYEWDEKNLDDFLTSIFDGYSEAEETGLSNKPVFFGTVQLNKESEDSDALDIVDGQQRLTTFLIFLDILQSMPQETIEDRIDCENVIDFGDLKNPLSPDEKEEINKIKDFMRIDV